MLDDTDIHFVCQQPVSDGKFRYFADLSFPQFNLYLEIDERYHLDPYQQHKDRFRTRDIWSVTNWKQIRISTHTEDGFEKDLSIINYEIKQFVNFLQTQKIKSIKKNCFQPWDYSNSSLYDKILEKGFLSIEENDAVLKQFHATKLFNSGHKGWQRGWWQIPGDTNRGLWFPKLYSSGDWTNILSLDGKKIEEFKNDGSEIALSRPNQINETRITFAHYKDYLNRTLYKYLGEFVYDQSQTTNTKHVYRRVSSETKLPIN